MNLINGKIVEFSDAKKIIPDLPELTAEAFMKGIDADTVISACGRLAGSLNAEEHIPMLEALGVPERKAAEYICEAKRLMSADALREKLNYELPPLTGRKYLPLGTLFHVAPGNAYGLAAYSVVEGLLAGCVNIVKTAQGDSGLTALILRELVNVEPRLSPFIYVFDFPSDDNESFDGIVKAADALVVWGGADTVAAVRAKTPPEVRLIEWGHKIGFAYVSGEVSDARLRGVAYNVFETEQRLCSSIQTVLYDTESPEELTAFAKRLLGIMADEAEKRPERGIKLAARKTLELYTHALEGQNALYKSGCGVIIKQDHTLKDSEVSGILYVKPLPRTRLYKEIRKYKSFLQTAALLCPDSDFMYLSKLLYKAGVTRVADGYDVSEIKENTPRDGELPLARYVKTIAIR